MSKSFASNPLFSLVHSIRLYWGCFTFFRLCTLVLISYISARSMLIIDLALIMASNAVLLPLGNQYEWALWVGSALMGVGVSSIYPTLWSFLELILPVTSKMTSVVNSTACLGEFIGNHSIPFDFVRLRFSWPFQTSL